MAEPVKPADCNNTYSWSFYLQVNDNSFHGPTSYHQAYQPLPILLRIQYEDQNLRNVKTIIESWRETRERDLKYSRNKRW